MSAEESRRRILYTSVSMDGFVADADGGIDRHAKHGEATVDKRPPSVTA